ncbi:flagellar biosynthetic protein FliR, partial [bacterium AH-315-N14]|nr:flagellar biosynthetic protein FliR [bacterium AH-315-N14]
MGIPIFFPTGTPATAKVGFCVVFTFLILPGVNYDNVSLITNNTALIIFAIDEVITGLVLGYITKFCFFS